MGLLLTLDFSLSLWLSSFLLSILFVDDFLLLMVASLQWEVFEEENKASVRLVAGDNVEISRNLDSRSLNQYTSVGNFLHCRCVYVFVKVDTFGAL